MIPLAYNIRSMMVRKTTTAASLIGLALVVCVFAGSCMLGNSIDRTLGRAGSPDIAVVMRDGADTEMNSAIEIPQIGIVGAAREVARRADGTPDIATEVVAVLALDKVGDVGMSNAQIRGVTPDVYVFRPEVKIVAGRRARPGADECVIGKRMQGRFKGLDIGQSWSIKRNRPVKVVGVFEANASSYESEIWADLDTVRSSMGREGVVTTIRARLRSADQLESFRKQIEGNRQLTMQVLSEPEYYEKQSEGLALFMTAMGIIIAVFFSIGAMIGAMITMYAAVAGRRREIGTLRALGFSRWSILFSFLFESVVLGFVGGILGAIASLALGFIRIPLVNFQSWSEIVFTFEPTPWILLLSVVVACGMGLLGGLFPAVRAARISVLDALRG